jgi:hypothetical protein
VEEGGQKNYCDLRSMITLKKLVIKQLKIVEVEEGGPKKNKIFLIKDFMILYDFIMHIGSSDMKILLHILKI